MTPGTQATTPLQRKVCPSPICVKTASSSVCPGTVQMDLFSTLSLAPRQTRSTLMYSAVTPSMAGRIREMSVVVPTPTIQPASRANCRTSPPIPNGLPSIHNKLQPMQNSAPSMFVTTGTNSLDLPSMPACSPKAMVRQAIYGLSNTTS
ncbi:hypothetical protein D3C81_1646500 [compost metagenome]